MSSPLYVHIRDFSSVSPLQWASRAIRATPRCVTGKTSCWILTASRPSTPRLADLTITITTITIPRASVRTSNPAWCELSCHCGLHGGERRQWKLHVRHMRINRADISEDLILICIFSFVVCLFEGFLPGCIVLPTLTRLPPSRSQIFLFCFFSSFFLFGCTWENYAMKEMNEETPEAFKQTTLPIRTLTSVFFFKRSFRNTTYDAFAHVTRANKIYSM